MKLRYIFYSIIGFCFAKPIGHLIYDKKYLHGKYFTHIYSTGWLWVLKGFVWQKIFGFNRKVPWPVSPMMSIGLYTNIEFHPDDLNNFQGNGCYFQGGGKTVIGRGTWIAGNVGIITKNHDLYDLDNHTEAKPVIIGEKCWLGMNSVILPGVKLGEGTVVGAGSVVTKSFEDGHCVIAGNPAKLIKKL